MDDFEIKIKGYDMIRKKAKLNSENSSSCTLYVPKNWNGKNVTIILNEDIEE